MVILFAHSQTPRQTNARYWLYAGSSHLVLRQELKKMGMNIINDDITGRVHRTVNFSPATVLLQRMRWVNCGAGNAGSLRELIPVTL